MALALLSCGVASAQDQPDAEIVLKETTYRLNADNAAEITVREQIRAITGKGRAEIAKIQIPYVSAFAEVDFQYVRTLKKDGSMVEGDPSSAFDTASESNPNSPAFSDSKIRTVLPPNPEAGDSVEFKAVIRVHKWPAAGEFWFFHYLTRNLPVRSETIVLDLPSDRRVTFYESGSVAGKTESLNGRRIERWATANLAPEKNGIEAVEPLFAVSSVLSWDQFGKWMHSLNDAAAEPNAEIAALAQKLTSGKSGGEDKIAALYAYVATKVRYVSVSFGVGRIQPHAASAVLHNGYGDCKDQTALLSALLKSAGFTAHAVLTTPGAGVLVPDVPSADQFSHEFTAVETTEGLLFLDPSIGPASPGVLPSGVRGRSAVLIGDGGTSVIEIPSQSPVPNQVLSTIKGRVTALGAFEGSAHFEFRGVAEALLRRVYADASAHDRESLLRAMAGIPFLSANLRQISSSDAMDLSKPFWIQCEINDPAFFPVQRTSIRVATGLPQSISSAFQNLKKPDKPFPMESGSFGVKMDLIIAPSLMITNGMAVHQKTAFGEFNSEYSYDNGHLKLERTLELNGTSIAPADWNSFVKFVATAESEATKGFALERHTAPPVGAGVAPITKALREGAAAFQRRDYEGAKRAYLEATKLEPQSRSAWNSLGRAYAGLREFDKAETAYKRQIELNPKDLYAYNNLGVTYRQQKRETEAIECFQKQIAISPRDRYAHDNLSISYAAAGRWEEARAEAAIAAEITPDDALKQTRLGRAQVKTGHLDDAANSFERALAQVHDAMTENNIAYFMADARMDLDKAWQLVSGTLNPEAKLVCQPETLEKSDKCAAELRRLAFMLDTAGWVLYRRGKIAEAEPYLRSSFAIAPRSETEIHLVAMLSKKGSVEEALTCFLEMDSRSDFARVDSKESRTELASALGGETALESRLKEMKKIKAAEGSIARVAVLVDEKGKVMDARPLGTLATDAIVTEAKRVTLVPIEWPEHSIRSVRTIEFRKDGEKWIVLGSFAGQAPETATDR